MPVEGDRAKAIDDLIERAIAAYRKGRFYISESMLYKVLWTMEISTEQHVIARTLLGNALRRMGRTVEAEKELSTALKLANSEGKARTTAELLLSMGKIQFRKADLKLAEEFYKDALESAKAKGDQLVMGKVLIDLGNIQIYKGNYEEAEQRFAEGVKVIEGTGNVVELIRGLHNLSYVHFHRKDLAMAEDTLLKCNELCKDMEEATLCIHTYSNLAHTYIQTGNLGEAETFLNKAGSLIDKTEDKLCRLNVRWVQGLLLAAKGDLDGALYIFGEMRTALSEVKAHGVMVEFILDYIPILIKTGNLPLARDWFAHAKEISEKKFVPHFKKRLDESEEEIRAAMGI